MVLIKDQVVFCHLCIMEKNSTVAPHMRLRRGVGLGAARSWITLRIGISSPVGLQSHIPLLTKGNSKLMLGIANAM